MRTLCGFLTVSAALNKRVPCSQGIETTQFHSVLLCCQLAFSIPLSPQKPQHRSLAWTLYNRSFHSCFGTCSPGLTSATNQRKHLPKSAVLGTLPCAAVEQRHVGVIRMLTEKGGRPNLGENIPAATPSALNAYCVCTVPGTKRNTPSLPLTCLELPGGKRPQNQTYQSRFLLTSHKIYL